MPQRIIIVRHGETAYNVERRLQGWTDIELNDNGVIQAEKVAARLRGEQVSAIYSSDLKRAHLTAVKIGNQLGLTPHKRRNLREDTLGLLEGWAWEREPDVHKQQLWDERELAKKTGDLYWNKHQGDSTHSHTQRVRKFFKEIDAKHVGDTVIVVTHGGTMNRIMEIHGFKKTTDDFIGYKNTCVTILVKSGDGYKVEIDNDISHL